MGRSNANLPRLGHRLRRDSCLGRSGPRWKVPATNRSANRLLTVARDAARVAASRLHAPVAPLKFHTLAIVFVFLLSGCNDSRPEIVLSGPTMGTTYTVRIVSPGDLSPHDARILIEQELSAVDASMSGYREDSELSRFNASDSTDWFAVSKPFADVVEAALEVGVESGGAFDVAVAPLVRLWGFGPSEKEGAPLPTEQELAAVGNLVNGARLHVREAPSALRKEAAAMQIDLNGIAPGYAVDRIAGRLDALALKNYMIDVGGEIRVRGRNKEGERWRIAVERPRDADRQAFAVLQLDGESVATSGEYRHFVIRDGKRYSHTIDPRTGAPIRHSLASVVVVHPQAMYADAWATAYNVLGPREGYELAMRLSMPVMFIIEEHGELKATMTPEFCSRMKESTCARSSADVSM